MGFVDQREPRQGEKKGLQAMVMLLQKCRIIFRLIDNLYFPFTWGRERERERKREREGGRGGGREGGREGLFILFGFILNSGAYIWIIRLDNCPCALVGCS